MALQPLRGYQLFGCGRILSYSFSRCRSPILTLLSIYRKEKSRIPRQQKQTLRCTAQEQYQAHPSSRPISQHPACSAHNVFAISICLRLPLLLTSHLPTTLATVPMKRNTRSTARAWRSDILKFVPNVSLT